LVAGASAVLGAAGMIPAWATTTGGQTSGTSPPSTVRITNSSQKGSFAQAVGVPNAVVTIAGNVELDLLTRNSNLQ
jgi:hypothetical protein